MFFISRYRTNFKLKSSVHALLFFQPEFAKRIVRAKREWLKGARDAVARGERIGDVAATAILDHLISIIRVSPQTREQLLAEIYKQPAFDDLKAGNQAIISMLTLAKQLGEPTYSQSLGYVIAHRYAQAIAPRDHVVDIADTLIRLGDEHLEWFHREFQSARTTPEPVPRDDLSEQHLAIVHSKVHNFVEQQYALETNEYLRSFIRELDAIDTDDPVARERAEALVNKFRKDAVSLNEWAWDQAQALIVDDVEHLQGLADRTPNGRHDLGDRLADIVEHLIEGQSKALIAQIAAVRDDRFARFKN